MIFALCVLCTVFGLFLGFLIGKLSRKTDGMFIINDSNEETTRWILDVTCDPKDIPKKKEVLLKVKKTDDGDV